MKALVDPNKCTACGVCEEVCPASAITLAATMAQVSDDCTLCGMCELKCPDRAIRVEKK